MCTGASAGEGGASGKGPGRQVAAGHRTWAGAGPVCLEEMVPCPSLGPGIPAPCEACGSELSLYLLGLCSGGDDGASLAGLPRTPGRFCSAPARSGSRAPLTTAPHSVKCHGRGGFQPRKADWLWPGPGPWWP